MDPTLTLPPLNLYALMKVFQIHPKKGLGQNFLVDDHALQKVMAAAEITRESAVLEVGPGLGSLTRYLAANARRVVAVELDKGLFPALEQVVGPFGNVTLVQGDILDQNPAELMGEAGYVVCANIPYYITSALIRHLIEAPLKPVRLALTVQREVAERICAKPGDMSLLALSVQVYGSPKVVGRIPAGSFYPPPAVDSSILRIDIAERPAVAAERLDIFFKLIKAGFGQKRKMLKNTLSSGMSWLPAETIARLEGCGIDPHRRAETLSLEEWGKLTESC
jgi:16S rRNA (adenine1518-N6/adenine1519-N6)-dimethyltransferase